MATANVFNGNDYKTRQSLALRPTYDELINGFTSSPGTKTPTAPTILRVVSNFRTIHIVWDRQNNLTNLSHYIIQVSEDNINWYSLRFDGTDWGDTLDEYTIVYDNSIDHCRIPHKESGSIRQLYYRVASVTLLDEQSPWSESKIGNTTYIMPEDFRPGYYFDDFVYDGFGSIYSSGQAQSGIHMYIGSGDITMSGGGNYSEYNKYSMVALGGVSTSGSADTSVEYNMFSDAAVFESTGSNGANKTNMCYMAQNKFIVTGDNGECKVATVTDSEISYGSAYSFTTGSTNDVNMSQVDSTHFVVVWKDTTSNIRAKIGTVSGTTITFGSEESLAAACNITDVITLDSSNVVISYINTSSNIGYSLIGSISGTTITFNTPTSFGSAWDNTSGTTFSLSTAALTSSKFVVAFVDDVNSNYGTAVIGTVSGTTITFGTESVFRSSSTFDVNVTALTSTTFMLAYEGQARIGIAVTDSITLGTNSYTFNSSASYASIYKLDASNAVIAYSDGTNGKVVIANNASSTITFSDEEIFNGDTQDIDVIGLTSSQFAVSYADGDNSYYGTCIIGNIY